MCWINWYVIYPWAEDTTQYTSSMNTAIKHRWPDDEWIRSDEKVALGQVRLSILDLTEAGHNPMFYSKKHGASSQKYNHQYMDTSHICISYNGEVYNYIEIRKELVDKGYIFSTGTDTEVILASYLEWWQKCVQRFNGMRAFCMYDMKKNILFLSRDRLGVKPLHYYYDEHHFLFSSEIKWLLAHTSLQINTKANINEKAVGMFFDLWFIPAPETIFKHVYKLDARQNLVYELSNKRICKETYFDIPEYQPVYDKAKLIKQGRELLQDAVNIRMRSDVPVWAFLSGWLDSSSVVGSMKELAEIDNIHTFSIWFEGKFDESPAITIAKDYFWSNHHHYYFTEKDAFDKVEEYVTLFDEPYADFWFLPTLKISELAKKHITVTLTWDGWDEIFWWYWSYPVIYAYMMMQKIPLRIRNLLFSCINSFKKTSDYSLLGKVREFLRFSREAKKESLFFDLFPEKKVASGYGVQYYQEKRKLFLDKPSYNLVEVERAYNLFYSTLSDNYLVKVDRATMKYGLEWRSPFLDYRFIAYSFTIPTEWKVGLRKTKKLMREICKDIVPPKILHLKKRGFTPPFYDYLFGENAKKELMDTIDRILHKNILPQHIHDMIVLAISNNNNNSRSILLKAYLFAKRYTYWVKTT